MTAVIFLTIWFFAHFPHIRGNWELQWNYEKLEFLEEEDSFAKDLNQLLRDIADYELPCNYRYHASEDIIARLVKKHLHWNIYRDRRGCWHGAEYIWIIEQGTLYDIDQQEILKATGMIKYLQSEEELALILAHEIGHLEFHHSVRELTPADYAQFALNALMAGIDLNDPSVKNAIKADAERVVKSIPFIDKLPAKDVNDKIAATIDTTTKQLQTQIDAAKEAISVLLTGLSDSLKKGYTVEFEAAADRRAVSLAAAAGYNADALLSTLARIKKDYNGFGEAYPVNRDELVAAFKADYAPKAKAAAIGKYSAIKAQAAKVSKKDLFVQK